MRALRSNALKALSAVLCFCAVFAFLCSTHGTYSDYILRYFHLDLEFSAAAVLLVGIVFLGLFVLSVWESGPSKNAALRWLNKVDFLLFAVISVSVVFLSANLLDRSYATSYLLVALPLVAFAVVMALVASAVARIRDGKLGQTITWVSFYRAYPINSLMGGAMSVLLAGNLLILVAAMAAGYKAPMNLLAFAFVVITLAILTFFSHFILSLAASYEKANEEKLKSERFKAELITNVSHDIRTPLTSVINYVDLIKRNPASGEELAGYIDVLDKKSQRLKTLIDDLLEASKASTGAIAVDLQAIDLTEAIGQAAGEFEQELADNRLALVFDTAQGKVPVVADGSLLGRVVENIFGNVVKYAMPGTRVYADITKEGGTATFSLKNVSRDPLNISPEELAARFVRGDRSRGGEGNGLGLYIAQNLTELMGGQFRINISGDLFEVEIKLMEK